MNNGFYIQNEVQENSEGIQSVIAFTFTDYNEALAKHFSVLAAAAKSNLPYHASFIITSKGVISDSKIFDRRTEEN